ELIALLPNAKEVFAALHVDSGADKQIISSGWQHVAEYSHALARRLNHADTGEFRFVRNVLVEAAEQTSAESHETDLNWETPAWSPTPQHEAAQTLPWLTHLGVDSEILRMIKKLAGCAIPSVRFLLAS